LQVKRNSSISNFNMSGILKLLYKLGIVVFIVLIIFLALYKKGFQPLYTNSTSFDAKIDVINHQANQKPKFIAIGSSMTLYNLNSEILTNAYGNSYCNLSSWGLEMADIDNILFNMIDYDNCKYVFICSSIIDFKLSANESLVDYLNTNKFLRTHLKPIFYFNNFTPLYQIFLRKQEMKNDLNDKDHPYSLNFDHFGGVSLNVPSKNINKDWDRMVGFPSSYTNYNYKALENIARKLKKHNIKLIFIQTPMKIDFLQGRSAQQILASHINICKQIVEKNNGHYLNLYDPKLFPDSLFVDQIHLQNNGSRLFTQLVVERTKKIIK
jgi:hypothetical protein